MTLALATVRSIVSKQSGQSLHVDYTAPRQEDFAYHEELRTIAAKEKSISVNFRETRRDGRLKMKDVQQLVHQYSNAVFYICGPRSYQNAVQSYLTQCEVHAERIKVKEFISSGQRHATAISPKTDLIYRLSTGKGYIFLGLLFFIAFLIQDALDLEFEWLAILQRDESYKRWTGWFFAGYIAYQWFLSILRLLGYVKEKITIQQYHLHKLAGVLAR